ncbi:MAG: hypothetical protein NZT92_14870 [Abditibacteriales bacterium]|nr:hypothetical protein [Abditibacteriales bacterium]MDW8367219.1 hypothetical protein [Abditibacteriales bacterium]
MPSFPCPFPDPSPMKTPAIASAAKQSPPPQEIASLRSQWRARRMAAPRSPERRHPAGILCRLEARAPRLSGRL